MVQITSTSLQVALAALMLSFPSEVLAFYSKNSAVTMINGPNEFKQKIHNSNYTSLVEFFAPWCGHCQNLKPTYEKLAENLKGLANVIAVDCDEDVNKQLCGENQIQGFPTIKRFSPRKGGKPASELYEGPRSANPMKQFVLETMSNNVMRLESSKKLNEFLSKDNSTTKLILFTNKGTTSPLYKAVAIDFKGLVKCAQVRDKVTEAVEQFGISKYPTLVLLPGGEKEGIVFDGEMKKDAIVKFVSQVAEPHKEPEWPPKKAAKKDTKKKKEETKKKEEKKEEEEPAAAAPEQPPKPAFDTTIPDLADFPALQKACLGSKAVCILAITPPVSPVLTAVESAHYYLHHDGSKNFPVYQIPLAALSKDLRTALELEEPTEKDPQGPGKVAVRAVNGRRGWWKKYTGDSADAEQLKAWLDNVKMGEGEKKKVDFEAIDVKVGGEKKEEPVAEEKAEEKKEETKEEKRVKDEL